MRALGRRALLKAAGVGAVGAMGLPLLAGRVRAGGDVPRRFVFVLAGNGFDGSLLMSGETREWIRSVRGTAVNDARWWGARYGARHTEVRTHATTFSTAPVLGPIDAHGLGDQAAVVLGLSSRITGGGHSAFHGVLSSTRTLQSRPGGQTLDAYLAQLPTVRGVEEGRTPFDAVRVGVHWDPGVTLNYGMCALGPEQPLPAIVDPGAAHDFLFGAFGGSGEEALRVRGRRYAMAAQETERRLAELGAHPRAQAQVQQYRDAIGELRAGQARLDEIRARALAEGATLPERPGAEPLRPLDVLRAQLRNVGAALRLGLTHVAVVGMGAGGGFDSFRYGVDEVTSTTNRHNLSHLFDSASREDVRAGLREAWRQEIGAVIELARELRDTPDPVAGSGSMLDHTAIIYLSDNGAEHHSGANEFPLLLLGGGALGLHTGGRTVIYPDVEHGGAQHRQVCNLWSTLGGPCAGTVLDEFGDRTGRVASGPLPDLLA